MNTSNLFILIGLPPQVRAHLGEEQEKRTLRAHPQARIELVDDPEHFAALLSKADAVALTPGFYDLPASALQTGTRLRWVQSLAAGVDQLLNPALIAAEHISLTALKGPMELAIYSAAQQFNNVRRALKLEPIQLRIFLPEQVPNQSGVSAAGNPFVAYSVDELMAFAEETGFDDTRKLKALRGYLESMQANDDSEPTE